MMIMIMMLMIIAIVYREGLGAIEGLRAERRGSTKKH
jgi:hypothetical protein